MKTTAPSRARCILTASATALCAFIVTSAHADTFGSGGNIFNIDFVPIGNAGNAEDTTGYGAVTYSFNMGTYQISQDQITKATASGLTSVTAGAWAGLQPAANITWFQAAAFVNWMNTSTGHPLAYNLDAGATVLTPWQPTDAGYNASNAYRNSNAYYFLPSENEYYKAAFYDPYANAAAGGYWLYATGSNTIPSAVASGTAAGTVVYSGIVYPTQPAAVNNSGGLSPYGTMGQSGNVDEWLESASDGGNNGSSELRAIRGGSWFNVEVNMRSSNRFKGDPTFSGNQIGFRVASVPEPSTWAVLTLGVASLLARRRRGAIGV